MLTQEAACATRYETQLQLAVAALEVLTDHGGFDDLKRILKAFFPGEDQEERIGKLVALRHEITHEGAGYGDTDQRAKSAARDALVLSWMLIDAAAAFTATVPNMPLNEYLNLLTSVRNWTREPRSLPEQDPGPTVTFSTPLFRSFTRL